jgi:hypothetical protein
MAERKLMLERLSLSGFKTIRQLDGLELGRKGFPPWYPRTRFRTLCTGPVGESGLHYCRILFPS